MISEQAGYKTVRYGAVCVKRVDVWVCVHLPVYVQDIPGRLHKKLTLLNASEESA